MQSAVIQDRLKASFNDFRDNISVRYGHRQLSYGELDRKSDRIARWLIRRGIEPETFIGILMNDTPELISTLIGILKARCVFVPLDSAYPRKRMETMIGTADLSIVIRDNDHQAPSGRSPDLFAPGTEFVFIEDIYADSKMSGEGGSVDMSYGPEDKVYIYYTSGTTGTPKVVLGKNKSLLHFIRWEIDEFGIDGAFRVSQFTVPTFDVFLRDILVPLCAGGTICIPANRGIMSNPDSLIDWIDREGINLIHCVPGLFRIFNGGMAIRGKFTQLKYVLLAGEKIIPDNLRTWYETFGERIQIVNLYGPTETTMAKLFYLIRPADVDREVIPVGKPIRGAKVVIMDDSGNVCDKLTVGEICIRTPYRTFGYGNDPELTQAKFIKNPFGRHPDDLLYKTGDFGRFLSDGNVELLGRLDRQIKIRGIRLEPEEIENILVKHPGINDAVLIKKTDGGHEMLCAFVMKDEGYRLEDEQLIHDLKKYFLENLPGYMAPARIVPVPDFPRKPNGKIDYAALQEYDFSEVVEGEAPVKPRTNIERRLHKLWAEILKRDKIGITDNFFELGGNSLIIMNLIFKIQREFNRKFNLGEIFFNNTIEKQALVISRAVEEEYKFIRPVEKREYYPQSSAQKRLFVLDQFEDIGTTFSLRSAIKIKGKFNKERYEQAIRALIQRHESLRTSFEFIGQEPVQRIHHDVEFKIEEIVREGELSGTDVKNIVGEFEQPFDLSKPPLLRFGHLEIADNEHLLLHDVHHIIADGTSVEILVEDFIRLYLGAEPARLRLQYKDFSIWQKEVTDTWRVGEQEKYWLELFTEPAPKLNLPADFPRPDVFTFEGSCFEFSLEKEDTLRLRQFCLSNDVTLQMKLLAVFTLLLHKYSNQDDIVISCGVHGRNHTDLQQVVGLFVNVLPLRNFPGGDKVYSSFLEEVRMNLIQAFENQDVQFDRLVERLDPKKDASRNPLCDVDLTVQNFQRAGIKFSQHEKDVEFTPHRYEITTAKLDLQLFAVEAEDKITFALNYYTRLFKRETVGRMADNFLDLIKFLIENREVKLKDIQLREEEVLKAAPHTSRGLEILDELEKEDFNEVF